VFPGKIIRSGDVRDRAGQGDWPPFNHLRHTQRTLPMKKTVLTFGLISGVILSAMMALSLPFMDKIGFDNGMILGYTTMVIAFLLVFFGVRSYRDNVGGGTVRFGRAFIVGFLISVVSSCCYVATWQVIYFKFQPDFLAKYSEHMVENARKQGVSEEKIAQQKKEMDEFAVMYQNPAFNAAITFLEPLPVALIVSLVSAGALSRRKKPVVA
jgi:hypothetical protein